MPKLMISMREDNFRVLSNEAKTRGITLQELLRAVIVPDWIRLGDVIKPRTRSVQQRPFQLGEETVRAENRFFIESRQNFQRNKTGSGRELTKNSDFRRAIRT
jgi:hypothetical protein